MSDISAADTSHRAILAQIDRNIAETGKLLAEQSKLFAEQRKLAAEATKLDRDRNAMPWQVTAALVGSCGAMIAAGVALTKVLGL